MMSKCCSAEFFAGDNSFFPALPSKNSTGKYGDVFLRPCIWMSRERTLCFFAMVRFRSLRRNFCARVSTDKRRRSVAVSQLCHKPCASFVTGCETARIKLSNSCHRSGVSFFGFHGCLQGNLGAFPYALTNIGHLVIPLFALHFSDALDSIGRMTNFV